MAIVVKFISTDRLYDVDMSRIAGPPFVQFIVSAK